MKNKRSRMPVIGDLIIETDRKTQQKYLGIVCDIHLDDWGHQRNVYITWSGESPRTYREEHGYAGVNIHNLRPEFTIIRDGQIIL